MLTISGDVAPYDGRQIDYARPVRVYRNLKLRSAGGGPVYSVAQFGRVVAHATFLAFTGTSSLVVSRAGRERARRLGHKTVHAFIEGRIARSPPADRDPQRDAARPVSLRYDHKNDDGFVATIKVFEMKPKVLKNVTWVWGLLLRQDGAVAWRAYAAT